VIGFEGMKIKRLVIWFGSVVLLILILLFGPLLLGTRPLSGTELGVLTPIYQDSVQLDRIQIKTGGPLTWVYPGITIGNTISFPKGSYDSNDQKYQALLVHEVCHVWQYQHFGLGYIPRSVWELISQRDTYVIHYDESKGFRNYDVEEQCEIVAEYFLNQDPRYQSYIEEITEQQKF